MKRTFLYILAALLAMSCKNNSVQNKNEDDKPVITVTIEPLRYFTEAIAGDNFNVVSMSILPRVKLTSASVISVLNKPGWIS